MKYLGTVKSLWRYPVKSLLGEKCQELKIDQRGITGDRWFAVTNSDGKFGSGKNTRRFTKIDGLFTLRAAYQDDQLVITFPDGKQLMGNDTNINAALSAALGQPVTLREEADIPHFDAGAVHIITSASLNWLTEQLPDAYIDERRFRPNIVIDTEGHGPVEQSWIDKKIAIGNTVFRVVDSTERCVMTTLSQDKLPAYPQILRTIGKEADLCFGVYCTVETIDEKASVLRENDEVKLL